MKKKQLHDIYYALDIDTNEVQHIDDVPSGLKCNCICAACSKQMAAKKGNKRLHHFAHVENFDCLYAHEISVYYAIARELEKQRKLLLPPVILIFESNKDSEKIKEETTIDFDIVKLDQKEKNYPLDLQIITGHKSLRLLLDFDDEFSHDDLAEWKRIAIETNTACLLIHMSTSRMKYNLEDIILAGVDNKTWIHNNRIEKYRKKYYDSAVVPKDMFKNGAYCAAKKHYYKGKPSARWVDCIYCELSPGMGLCLAESYINHIEDFDIPFEERRRNYWEAWEAERNARIANLLCPNCTGRLIKRNGRNGEFLGCSNFPDCQTAYSIDKTTGEVVINS